MIRLVFRLFYRFYCYIYRSLRGKSGRYRILMYCPQDFHFFHMRPLVLELAADPQFDIRVVLDNVGGIESIANVRILARNDVKYDLLRPVDLFLTTEFHEPPWWFIDVKSAFFLHGIGPKVSYFVSPKLKNYDIVLAPSPFVEKKQRSALRSDTMLVSAGLPALDEFFNIQTSMVANEPSPKKRPLLLYAPSWSSEPEQITAGRDIIEAIIEQDVCDCIIRPHPLLMSDGHLGVPKIKKLLLEASQRNPAIQLHTGPGTSIYDILPGADILMSDISSVLYEFLIFNRPILLYLKDSVAEFYDAEDVIEQTRRASFVVTDIPSFHDALSESISSKDLHVSERGELLELMLHNPGNATEVMADFLRQYARSK